MSLTLNARGEFMPEAHVISARWATWNLRPQNPSISNINGNLNLKIMLTDSMSAATLEGLRHVPLAARIEPTNKFWTLKG